MSFLLEAGVGTFGKYVLINTLKSNCQLENPWLNIQEYIPKHSVNHDHAIKNQSSKIYGQAFKNPWKSIQESIAKHSRSRIQSPWAFKNPWTIIQ